MTCAFVLFTLVCAFIATYGLFGIFLPRLPLVRSRWRGLAIFIAALTSPILVLVGVVLSMSPEERHAFVERAVEQGRDSAARQPQATPQGDTLSEHERNPQAALPTNSGASPPVGDSPTASADPSTHPSPKSAENPAGLTPDELDRMRANRDKLVVISPKELSAAYEANEIDADNRFRGKPVAVVGVVENIGKDILDTMYLTLDTPDPLFSIQAFFPPTYASRLATLRRGHVVAVQCRCDGKFGNILLRDCMLIMSTDRKPAS